MEKKNVLYSTLEEIFSCNLDTDLSYVSVVQSGVDLVQDEEGGGLVAAHEAQLSSTNFILFKVNKRHVRN